MKMPKIAVIIVGEHASGKSRLIKQFIKRKLGMSPNVRLCKIGKKYCCIKSQTLQEARDDLDDLKKLAAYDAIALPSWPDGNGTPALDQIRKQMASMGFRTHIIQWTRNATDELCEEVGDRVVQLLEQ
jgi:hypothetical protein